MKVFLKLIFGVIFLFAGFAVNAKAEGYEDPRSSNPTMTCFERREDPWADGRAELYKIVVQSYNGKNSSADVYLGETKIASQLPCKPSFYDPIGSTELGHSLIFICSRPYSGPALPPNEYGVGITWSKSASLSSADIDHGERGASITLTNLNNCVPGVK